MIHQAYARAAGLSVIGVRKAHTVGRESKPSPDSGLVGERKRYRVVGPAPPHAPDAS